MPVKRKVWPKHLSDVEAIDLLFGPPDILTEGHFRVYQRWMAKLALKQDVFLAAEMGLGKTGASLWAIVEGLKRGLWKRPLIVAPMRVAEETWPEEIRTWDFARDLKYRVVTGSAEERMAALRYGPAEVTIINRENLRWLDEVFAGKAWPFDMLVYDEASRLKRGMKKVNLSRAQKKAGKVAGLTELGVLTKHKRRWKRIIELSGTPSPNGLIDLYGPISVIDDGSRLGTSMTAYKNRWFIEDRDRHKIEPRVGAREEIMQRIDDIFYSLREEDYLDLPPLVPVDHVVRMPPKAMAAYREFEKHMGIELQNHAGDPEYIEAVNNGVLTGKLLQIANGSIYTESKEAIPLHDEKMKVLESIMEEAAGKPVLVAYSFQFDKDAIVKKFPYCRVYGDNPHDMRDWNAGRIRMLLLHPASAGHGLNFQKGSNIAVWYGLTWSLELYRQFLKRLHRPGQKEDMVFMHRILSAGTVDSDVLKKLEMRGVTQDDITEVVRVRLGRAIERMAA